MEAYAEAILDQNMFDDVGEIILYPYVVLSGLSQNMFDILIKQH